MKSILTLINTIYLSSSKRRSTIKVNANQEAKVISTKDRN